MASVNETTESKTLDLSNQQLKKLEKCTDENIETLVVDDNDLQRLDHLDSYVNITKLSIVRNQLLRMYGVSKLHNLVTLNLANNGILTIEGTKDMPNLQTLCLAGNNIKSIEHLHTNTKLEHLDLSENSISHISDISYLRNLKELFLHNNRIITLFQCERYLPTSLETFTLANNNITDLNEMSHLTNLTNVIHFSIANNPCVSMSGNSVYPLTKLNLSSAALEKNSSSGFDYRPFVINWCMSLKSIDGYAVDPIESLKAEWLYSQGRGRQFRVGEHTQLAQYLASVCPLSGESLENETDKKLRLILSKAQHHQKQLSLQSSASSVTSSVSPSPLSKRRLNQTKINSPRRPGSSASRSSARSQSPDRMIASCHVESMVSSCHDNLDSGQIKNLMSQSLDPSLLSNNLNDKLPNNIVHQELEEKSNPLQALSKLVPVPESLMSPDFRPPSGLCRMLPKALPTKPNSPSQITVPSKVPLESETKTIPMMNNPPKPNTPRTNVTNKVHATNSSASKVTIAKPVFTNANGKCPQSVKINNYVQSKTLPAKRSARNSPNMNRTTPRSKSVTEKTKPSQVKKSSSNIVNSTVGVLSSDEDSEFCHAKLDSIKHKASQKRQQNSVKVDPTTKAAICIQKIWRGYHTRNLNKNTTEIVKTVEMMRTNKYIQKLSTDMEAARSALENEHKLQLLQMQAINALWKKVVTLQPNSVKNGASDSETTSNPNSEAVVNLAQTCNSLQNQVQQLQESMLELKKCMMQQKVSMDTGVATQTEISAVHTPAGEENKFPYHKPNRPQTLSIQTIQECNEKASVAVQKHTCQSTDTTDDEVNTDILNSNDNPDVVTSNDNAEIFTKRQNFEDGLKNAESNSYNEMIDNNLITGQVNEEELCKELHNLIETEKRESDKQVDKQV